MPVKYGDQSPVEIGCDQPILDELESQGLSPDSGCRAASCGVCACEVVEGIQGFSEMDPVEKDTVDFLDKRTNPVRLICRSQLTDAKVNVVLKPYHQ